MGGEVFAASGAGKNRIGQQALHGFLLRAVTNQHQARLRLLLADGHEGCGQGCQILLRRQSPDVNNHRCFGLDAPLAAQGITASRRVEQLRIDPRATTRRLRKPPAASSARNCSVGTMVIRVRL
jgi:hypothetical protein